MTDNNLPRCISKGQIRQYFIDRDGYCSYQKLATKIFTDEVLEQIGITREQYKRSRDFDIRLTEKIYQVLKINSLNN